MLTLLQQSVDNIDWNYVDLSQQWYGDTDSCITTKDKHWQERPFAYEVYHQLRCLPNANQGALGCVIQGDVHKGYQKIRNLNKMPDLLFHDRQDLNLAVVEIKLVSNRRKPVKKDLEKLAVFREELKYQYLVEILIGSDDQLTHIKPVLKRYRFGNCNIPIHILTLSLSSHTTELYEINKQR